MIDLIAKLHLPAVVMVHSRLGAINHTLLTLEALRGRAIPVAKNFPSGVKASELI